MELSYRKVKVEIPIENALRVESICLKQALNEHTTLFIKLLMEEDKIVKEIESLKEDSCITIKEFHRENKREQAIFKGKPLKINMQEEEGLYYLTLECIAYTYDWDLKKKSQSFCDLDDTYFNVIQKVLEPYEKKDFQDKITHHKIIPDFLLQYEETDWTFLKRLATHFETFLLEDPTEQFGRIYFGLPQLNYGISLQKDDFVMKKDLKKYYYFNALEAYFPQETITWQIQTPIRLYLGEEVLLNKVKTQVTKVTIETLKEELIFSYELSRLKGVRVPYQPNPNIYGMSIPAVVKERKGNAVRVHFDIDPQYEAKPHLKYFTYAIESSSFYCMPEIGSKVHIYFPSHDETKAMAVHAIRMASSDAKFAARAQNPNHKSFSNVTGSEMKMTENDVSFAADNEKKIAITLDEQGNINLVGKNITFETDKSFNIGNREAPPDPKEPHVRPKSIHIAAKEKLSLVREKDETQGITLDEQARIIATFIKKDCSVKNPPSQSPDSFLPTEAEDKALIDEQNSAAKAQLEVKREAAVKNIRKGVCSVLKVVAVVGLIAVTGGMAAGPLAVAVAATGAAKTVMAVSDIAEGVQDYRKSQSGDLRQSYNPVRDSLFGGNEELYRAVQEGVDIAFGIVSSIACGSNLNSKLKLLEQGCKLGKKASVLFHMGVNGATAAFDSYANTGKIDPKSLAFNMTLGFLTGKAGETVTNKILVRIGSQGANLKNPIVQKVGKVVVGTFVDTGIDAGISFLTNQPFKPIKSFFNNGTARLLQVVFAEPIDAVTGSFLIQAVDFKLPDLEEAFKLERQYSSTNKKVGIFGKGWTFNYDSKLFRDGARVYATLVTGHTVSFIKVASEWQNAEGESRRFKLSRDELHSEWLIKDYITHKTYVYDAFGYMIRIVDKNNQKLILEYNNQKLEKITTSLGYEILFTFEEEKLVQITDGLGRTLQYRYEGDLLTHIVHLDQGISSYTYTKEGYIESATDKNGVTYLKNKYDAEGRTILQTLNNGYTYKAHYDIENGVTTVDYNNGEKVEYYHYNKDLLVTQIKYSDGTIEEYGYDGYKNRCYEKNRKGFIIQKRYSPYSYLLEEKQPNGYQTDFIYNAQHDLIKKQDNEGRESLYTYDFKHNLIQEKHKITVGKWQTKNYTYDYKGRIIEEEDSLKGKIEYTYDKDQSKPTRVKNAMGEITYYEYDKVGRRMSIENEYGTVEFGYNNLNHVTHIKDGEGHVTQKLYDQMGKLIAFYPPKAWANKEKGYTYKYDFLDQLVEVIDPLEQHYKEEKDIYGNVLQRIHPNTYDPKTEQGLSTKYTYDTDGNCIKKEDLEGGVERLFYDSECCLIKHVLPSYYNKETDDGIGYSYTYDEMNHLTEIISPEGQIEKTYTYDLKGHLIKETDAKGYRTLYSYDLLGQLIEKRAPIKEENGKVFYQLVVYDYDLNGNKIAEKYATEYVQEEDYPLHYHTIYLSYDKNNHLIQVRDDYGAQIRYTYNALGQRSYEERTINDKTQQCIYYSYNKAGWLIQKKEALDSRILGEEKASTFWAITKYSYDENGNLIEILTPKGYQIQRTYDACDRMIAERIIDTENGLDKTTAYHYDAAHNITQVELKAKDEKTTRWAYGYDLKDRLTHKQTEEGAITRYFYDANDRLIKEVNPENYNEALDDGPGTFYTYDIKDNLLTITNALGQKVQDNTYDIKGQLTCQKDALGYPIYYDYTLDHQIKDIRSPKSQKQGQALQSYTYNARGQIIGLEDGHDAQTFYKVDGWGRIIEITAADGGIEKYTYDAAGNITSTTDAKGGKITYTYNNLNKVSQITDQEGLSETFYYDEEGRLTLYKDKNGNQVENTYNAEGSLLSEIAKPKEKEETPLIKRYTYNTKGQLIKAQSEGFIYTYHYTKEGYLQSKSTCGKTLIAYTYNKNGQIKALKDITGQTTYYYYDPLGRIDYLEDEKGQKLVSYTYTPNSLIHTMTYGNAVQTTYTYDHEGNITHLLTTTAQGEKLQDYDYTYDLNGNRLSKEGLGQKMTYTYDAMNRLTQTKDHDAHTQYTYDLVGNRLTQTTSTETIAYTYNAKNQLTQLHQNLGMTTFTYDKQGSILKINRPQGTTHFKYNALNQQTQVTTPQKDTLINHYDPEGLRAEIEENQKLTKFIFHQGDILLETDNEDNTLSRFTRGYAIVASDRPSDKENNELKQTARYYYQQDEQYSTAFITDKEGTVKNFYKYDAFGNIVESQENISNRITYTGQQYDAITQQYYLRARFYNPILGRFMQEDPYHGDGLNLYAYCKNNPVMYYDPSGYASKKTNCGDKGDQSPEDNGSVVPEGSSTNVSGKTPIEAYEVTTYDDFAKRSVVGDGLEGHEIWQHANLNEQGLATTRLSTDASKQNIVMALPHDVHVEVNRNQSQHNARIQTPIENVNANVTILNNNSKIPQSSVLEAQTKALQYVTNTIKKGN